MDRVIREGMNAVEPLLKTLDRPIDTIAGAAAAAVGLGQRGHSLYRGILHSLSGPSNPSAFVILRSMLDLAILLRWIEEDPATHIELWFAEDDRQRLLLVDEIGVMHRERGVDNDPSAHITDEVRLEWRAGFREIRGVARDAGIHVPSDGALLPSNHAMAAGIPELTETYRVAYRAVSPWTHHGGMSFHDDVETRLDGHQYIKPVMPWQKQRVIGLALTTLCQLEASVSRQAGIGNEAAYDAIRLSIARWPGQNSVP